MINDICNFVLEMFRWQNIAAFLNSNFTAALAGAFAGALAAQKISERAKLRNQLLQEIRSTNAAIAVSFTICNAALSLKKQFVKDIYETYTAKKSELEEFHRQRAGGQQAPNLPFEFRADFRTLQMPLVPTDILQKQVYEGISTTGRPLGLIAAISGSVDSLKDTIQKRNILIERSRELDPAAEGQLAAFYFGLPYGPGHVNTEYPDSIESLNISTDDVIFFSELLMKDLMEHGNRILKQYNKITKVNKEKISSVDLTEPREQGLMPDEADYADWVKGFQSAAQQE
jgi:hypothetical protein